MSTREGMPVPPLLTGAPADVVAATLLRAWVVMDAVAASDEDADVRVGYVAGAPTEAAWWLAHLPATVDDLAVALARTRLGVAP